MSTCPDSDLWSALIDGEVPSPWKEKMERHLDACPDCQKRMDRYRKVNSIMNSRIPSLSKERLEASYVRLFAKRAQAIAMSQSPRVIKPQLWTNASIRFTVPAFAAVLAAAIFLPSVLVLTTISRMQTQEPHYVAMLPAMQNGPVDIVSSVKNLATSDQVYSPDLMTSAVSTNLLTQKQKQLFRMVNYARQYTADKELFSDSDIIIIKMPQLTRFSTTTDQLFATENTLGTNAGFMK